MNIEIANKLVKLRKEKGLSQEELAEKLGLSRQAVSKWERAEASPDTDNLICLAKLYGVSLDELLSTDETIDEIIKEQVNGKENAKTANEKVNDGGEQKFTSNDFSSKDAFIHVDDDGDKVYIGPKGIHVSSSDGEEVHIGVSGIHVENAKGDENKEEKKNFHFEWDYDDLKAAYRKAGGLEKFKKRNKMIEEISGIATGIYALLVTIAFFLIGTYIDGGWGVAWILFVTIPLVPTLISAIGKQRFCIFCYPVLITAIFLFLGMQYGLWHPMWLLFITIPIYYTTFAPIDKLIKKHQIKKALSSSGIVVDDITIEENKDKKED